MNESVKYMDEGRRRELNDRMMEGTKRLSLKEKRKKEGGIKEGRNWEGRSYNRKEGGTVVVHRQADNYLVNIERTIQKLCPLTCYINYLNLHQLFQGKVL